VVCIDERKRQAVHVRIAEVGAVKELERDPVSLDTSSRPL
jgi:hypothetical protein